MRARCAPVRAMMPALRPLEPSCRADREGDRGDIAVIGPDTELDRYDEYSVDGLATVIGRGRIGNCRFLPPIQSG